MRSKFPHQTYTDTLKGLIRGPKQKTAATIDLENICHAFLNPAESINCQFNSLDELEVCVNNKVYNLTLILQDKPDFDNLEFTDSEIDTYSVFISSKATLRPAFNGAIPSEKDYQTLDPTGENNHLQYGEKLAITLYTSTNFKLINDFLRLNGQVKWFRTLDQSDLTSTVKELLLATAICTHGLVRIPAEDKISSVDEFELLFRAEESVNEVNAERTISVSKKTYLSHRAFTSSSLNENLTIGYLENFEKKNNGEGTLIYIEQPKTKSAFGRDIHLLSEYAEEGERLFPPSTQFKYYYQGKDKNRNIFIAVPIRTPEKTKMFNYSYESVELRREMLKLCENLVLNSKIDELFILKSMIDVNDKKSKQIFSNLLSEIDAEIAIIEWMEANKEIIEAANYALREHLSQTYKELSVYSADAEAYVGSEIIVRSNHGLRHSVGVAAYLPAVIDYFAQHAKDPEFRKFTLSLKITDIKLIQIALIFFVTGRESEASFKDNLNAYYRYRKASFENFKKYAKLKGSSDSDIEKFHRIIETDRSFYADMGSKQTEEQHLFNIMIIAHRLDLMRCVLAEDFNQLVNDGNKLLVTSSQAQKEAFNKLLSMARDTLLNTGDRLMCTFDGTKIVEASESYNPKYFIKASRDVKTCLKMTLKTVARSDIKITNTVPKNLSLKDLKNAELYEWVFFAAKKGSHHLLKKLIPVIKERGLNLNHQLKDYTMLHFAAKNGHIELVKLLLKEGADPNIKNRAGTTALHVAAVENRVDIITFLIKEYKADPNCNETAWDNSTPLIEALNNKHVAAALALLQNGADPNRKAYLVSPLHRAIDHKLVEAVKFLMEKGADAFQKNELDQNAFQNASLNHDSDSLKVLTDFVEFSQIIKTLNPTMNNIDANLLGMLMDSAIMKDDIKGIAEIVASGVKLKPKYLINAITDKKSAAAEALIAHGANVNGTMISKIATPLHAAISADDEKLVDLLLQKNANVKFLNQDLKTPLHFVFSSRNINILKLFFIYDYLDKNKQYDGKHPLEWMIENDNDVGVSFLLQQRITLAQSVSTSIIFLAVASANIKILEALLNQPGIDPNVRNQFLRTPLMIAVMHESFDKVILLLENGANPIYSDKHKATALHYLVKRSAHFSDKVMLEKSITALLEKGADPLSLDDDYHSALSLAFKQSNSFLMDLMTEGNKLYTLIKRVNDQVNKLVLFDIALQRKDKKSLKMCLKKGIDIFQLHPKYASLLQTAISDTTLLEVILESGININKPDARDKTLLQYAVEGGHEKQVELLLQQGANASLHSNPPNTLLCDAIQSNNESIVQALLDSSKTNVNQANAKDKTPLMLAAAQNSISMTSTLIAAGAQLNPKNGNTALHIACEMGELDLVKLLVTKGADINAINNAMNTPLHEAILSDRINIIQFLLKKGAETNPHKLFKNGGISAIDLAFSIGNVNAVFELAKKTSNKKIIELLKEVHSHNFLFEVFIHAISVNNQDIFRALIDKILINSKDKRFHQTPLHFAVLAGNKKMVAELLKRGADPEITDDEDKTPIHLALKNDQVKLLALLITKENRHSIINEPNLDGQTPLEICVKYGNHRSLQFLINQGADFSLVNKNLLYLAAAKGFDSVLEILLKQGSFRCLSRLYKEAGKNALHIALLMNHNKVIKLLIKNKIFSVNMRTDKNETPISLAASYGNKKTVDFLVKNGADVDVKDIYNYTPLMNAALNKKPDVIAYLVKQGADLNQQENIYGKTALMISIEQNDSKSFEILLAHGADLSLADTENKVTALHYAAARGNVFMIEDLISKGADINQKDKSKQTALHIAARSNNYAAVKVLLNRGAKTNINVKDGEGNTPLHIAVTYGLALVLDELINFDADVNGLNGSLESPLMLAATNGDFEIYKKLIKSGAKVTETNLIDSLVKNAEQNDQWNFVLYTLLGCKNISMISESSKNIIKNQTKEIIAELNTEITSLSMTEQERLRQKANAGAFKMLFSEVNPEQNVTSTASISSLGLFGSVPKQTTTVEDLILILNKFSNLT